MWKLKSIDLSQMYTSFKRLSVDRQLATCTLALLTVLYPGHNPLQQIVIKPGLVRSYTLPSLSPVLYPKHDGVRAPSVSARSVVIQDVTSKTLIYTKSPDLPLIPASTTKIMTALVALDVWNDLDTVIEVKNEDRAVGQTIKLQKGEQLTLRNILYGLLVQSGNDAALALADNYPGGYTEFVKAMNVKAKELHLDNTVYKNPSGIEQYGHVTTARDLAILAAIAIKNPVISEIVKTRATTITDIAGTAVHELETTNELLGVLPGIKGLKTGWTTNAGECLVSIVERDGHEIVVVVLGSFDRFGETTRLVEWVYAHHNWQIPTI